VCTISGTTVTGVAAGTCTIAADQAGNANYATAMQVTQSILVFSVVIPTLSSWGMILLLGMLAFFGLTRAHR